MAQRLDFAVRAPTGTGWLTAAVAVIATGELLFERHKETPAVMFTIPFADSEMLAMAAVTGVVALGAIVWLVWTYIRPGRLILDPETATLTRVRRARLRLRTHAGAASAWKVRLSYFSSRERQEGTFKRLELSGPELHEVLLFGDFQRGDVVARALEDMGPVLGGFDVTVDRPERG